MSAVGDARKRITEAAAPDAGTDVEALADVLRRADDDALVRTNFGQLSAEYEEAARAILASDWLAAHDAVLIAAAEARGAAEERERIARAIEAMNLPPMMSSALHRLQVAIADAARIARTAPATDRTEAGDEYLASHEVRSHCDGCIDLALAANDTRLPLRPDGHFVGCTTGPRTEATPGGGSS